MIGKNLLRHRETKEAEQYGGFTTRIAWLCSCILVFSLAAAAQEKPIILRADTALDGKGHVLHNVVIEVEGGKVTRVLPNSVSPNPKDQRIGGVAFYDLGKSTVLPG